MQIIWITQTLLFWKKKFFKKTSWKSTLMNHIHIGGQRWQAGRFDSKPS